MPTCTNCQGNDVRVAGSPDADGFHAARCIACDHRWRIEAKTPEPEPPTEDSQRPKPDEPSMTCPVCNSRFRLRP